MGKRLESLWGDVRVQVRDDRESPAGLTDYFMTVPFTIVSKPFAELLSSFGCEVEMLPLLVEYRQKRLHNEFFALNVLTVVESAVDRERSKFKSFDEGPLEEVEHLELKGEMLTDIPIAYLGEICKYAVSDELAAAITSSGMRGVLTIRPGDFTS
ncbi:hypothetical protein [Polaromonas sp. CT11-55]|uniref:hypothetical protein n=1 Tax=Polaromonas sp. CT11-55 TaxID=3243045 RepID=UPI0039A6EFEE